MTLQDVADKIGTTAVTVSRWEREPSRVTVPVLSNLAVALGCTREELLGAAQRECLCNISYLDGVSRYYDVQSEHIATMEQPTDIMAPTIDKGARCFLDTSCRSITTAGIYAVRFADAAHAIRALALGDGTVRLIGDNPLYKCDEYYREDTIGVVGRVVGTVKKF